MMRSTSFRLNIQHERGNRQTEHSHNVEVCFHEESRDRSLDLNNPRTGQFDTVSELKPTHTLHDSLRKLRQAMDKQHERRAEPYQSRQGNEDMDGDYQLGQTSRP
jgi:hypothetical protein